LGKYSPGGGSASRTQSHTNPSQLNWFTIVQPQVMTATGLLQAFLLRLSSIRLQWLAMTGVSTTLYKKVSDFPVPGMSLTILSLAENN
jgi:hypothetical protein